MARLGLKIFYLRTRERKLSQQAVADTMGVRQATLSHIEQGISMPSSPLLIELCRFYDVTPTFLLDEERGVVPLPSERWSMRNALVTVDMWVEAPADSVCDLGDGNVLCPMTPGASFYDQEAAALRREGAAETRAKRLSKLFDERRGAERALQRTLNGELRTHPRRRGRTRVTN